MSRWEHFTVGSGPVPAVAQGIARYHSITGQPPGPSLDALQHLQVDPVVSRHIANLYEQAPLHDEAAHPHFAAMREEVGRQFDFMTKPKAHGGMGMQVDVTPYDPYVKHGGKPDFEGMIRDVSQNNRLKVMSTKVTGEHPFFTDDENDMFRAVHDTFGHAGTGRDFSRHGEEAAWRVHRAMFTPLARPAMTAETRGQNSALNFGSNPGTFAPQKVTTLGSTAELVGRRSLHRALGRQWQTPAA